MTKPRLSLSRQPLSLAPDQWLWQSTIALATAILLILSFPGYEWSFLAWIALAPLLQVIAGGVTLRRAFWLGWLTGVVFTFFAENWIAHSMTHFGQMLTVVAYAVAFLFASILAVFPALFAATMALLVRRFGWWAIAIAPIVWVATEWLRQFVTGVTWNALGVSQVAHFPIARLARFGGVYLISAEVVAASSLLVLSLKLRERNVARAAAMLLIIAAMAFAVPEPEDQSKALPNTTVTVVGVQPNLPPDSSDAPEDFARNLENNLKLTRDAINRTPDKAADIAVWAESPLTLFYETDPATREKLDALARETGSYLIVNTVAKDDWRFHNSVHTIGPNQGPTAKTFRRYDKIRLVPFGEYVPWRAVLGRFVPAIVGDFTAGKEAVVNQLRMETQRAAVLSDSAPIEQSTLGAIERTTNYVRIGSFICYEAAYPDLVRRFVQNGATLLVNVSNDAWFGNTAGARQHQAHAMMRAIENDRDLVRVTNTGITALITADGQVVDPLPMFTAGSQAWQAQARRRMTFYAKNGDWFAIGCVVVSLIAAALAMIKKK